VETAIDEDEDKYNVAKILLENLNKDRND